MAMISGSATARKRQSAEPSEATRKGESAPADATATKRSPAPSDVAARKRPQEPSDAAARKRPPAGLSGAPPGPRQPDLRRAALTSAAAELFTSRGVDATTIDDIAARARLSKGSFYHYFRTKADILAAVRTRFAVEFRDRVAAAVERRGNASWAEKLGAWVEGMVTAYFELHALHDVLFHGGADAQTRGMPNDGVANRELVSEYLTVRHLIELLRSGTSAGAWHVQDPRAAAVFMFCGLHGAIDEALITGTSREEIAKTITPLFQQMVAMK